MQFEKPHSARDLPGTPTKWQVQAPVPQSNGATRMRQVEPRRGAGVPGSFNDRCVVLFKSTLPGSYPSTTWTRCSEPSSESGMSAPPESGLPSRLTRDTPRETPFGFSTEMR